MQSYVDFSNRWQVPLLVGETGEGSDDWSEKCRRLNEQFGIGWCFWPLQESRFAGAVGLDREAGGLELIASAEAWGSTRKLPPRERAQATLDAYLEADPVQERPRQRPLSQIPRPQGAVAELRGH